MSITSIILPNKPRNTKVSPLDDLLAPPAVAALLNVSPPTVYNAIHRTGGGLTHVRTPGGQIRIRRRDILAYCHRMGVPVPVGLVPQPADVVVLHPNKERGRHLKHALKPRCAVSVYLDPFEGLLQLGARRPPLAILSVDIGIPLISRLCDAVYGSDVEEYMAIIVLQRSLCTHWNGGPVPMPFPVEEPKDTKFSIISPLVHQILGFEECLKID